MPFGYCALHGLAGAELKIEAPLPADLQGFLDTLG
jgi:hypothetical protein